MSHKGYSRVDCTLGNRYELLLYPHFRHLRGKGFLKGSMDGYYFSFSEVDLLGTFGNETFLFFTPKLKGFPEGLPKGNFRVLIYKKRNVRSLYRWEKTRTPGPCDKI